jgi:hypothetical protein
VVGVDINICIGSEFVDLPFCPVLRDLGVTGELGEAAVAASPPVPIVEYRLGGADVNVIDPGEGTPERFDLAQLPD